MILINEFSKKLFKLQVNKRMIEKAMQEQKTTTVNEILKGSLENSYSLKSFFFQKKGNQLKKW